MSDADAGYRAWVRKAENDLLNIENNLASAHVPWDTVCFHAQQAAEKLLKALLVLHQQVPPRTHDLVALLALCSQLEPGLSDLEDECRRLSSHAVTSRYPHDLADPDDRDGRAAVAAARRMWAGLGPLLP